MSQDFHIVFFLCVYIDFLNCICRVITSFSLWYRRNFHLNNETYRLQPASSHCPLLSYDAFLHLWDTKLSSCRTIWWLDLTVLFNLENNSLNRWMRHLFMAICPAQPFFLISWLTDTFRCSSLLTQGSRMFVMLHWNTSACFVLLFKT